MRAIRLASATATSMRGLRASIRASHGSFVPRRAAQPTVAQGRRHTAGAGQRRAHRPPAQAGPAGADHDDAVRPDAHRPRRTRAAAALLRPAAPARHLSPTLDSGGSLPPTGRRPKPSRTRPCSAAPLNCDASSDAFAVQLAANRTAVTSEALRQGASIRRASFSARIHCLTMR